MPLRHAPGCHRILQSFLYIPLPLRGHHRLWTASPTPEELNHSCSFVAYRILNYIDHGTLPELLGLPRFPASTPILKIIGPDQGSGDATSKYTMTILPYFSKGLKRACDQNLTAAARSACVMTMMTVNASFTTSRPKASKVGIKRSDREISHDL